jgi:hypothetical protein
VAEDYSIFLFIQFNYFFIKLTRFIKKFSSVKINIFMSIPYYNQERIQLNTSRFRNWSIYQYHESERLKGNYKFYYIDSEWETAGEGDHNHTSPEVVNFTGLRDAFNDGSEWRIAAEDANSTGTFTLIVVRLKDRVVKKCVGVASGEHLANNALWTVTDVTGGVWYDDLRKLSHLGYI